MLDVFALVIIFIAIGAAMFATFQVLIEAFNGK